MTAQIVADVLLKTDGVTRGVQQTQSKMRGLVSSTGSVFKGILGSAVVLKGLDLIGQGVDKVVGEFGRVKEAGSNLQQSTGAVEAVFGKYTAGIKRSASQASQALGLSKNEYQELASVVGAGLKNKGIKDYAGETKKLLGLGGDLAAQFGGSTKEAVEAISSLMRGETDPIERYGVSINETAINAELAARGQDKLKGAALEQAKAQARVALLFKQTKDAQGAFARESDTLAGIQQRNAAEWENIRAKLGTALMPVFVASAKVMQSTVIPAVSKVAEWIGKNLPGALQAAQAFLAPVFDTIKSFASQIGPILSGLFSGDGGIQGFLAQVQPLGAALLGVFSSVKSVIAAVLPIVAQVLAAVISGVRSVLPELTSAYQAVASTLQSIASILTSVWKAIGPIVLPIVTTVFGTIIKVVSGALNIIAGIFKTIAAVLKGDWSGAWDGIKQIVSGAWSVIKAVVSAGAKAMAGAVSLVLNGIKKSFSVWGSAIASVVSGAWSKVKAVTSTALSLVRSTVSSKINEVKSVMSTAWSVIKSKASSMWDSIKSAITTKITSLVAKVRELPGRFRSALSGSLYGAGSRLIGTLVSGIRDRISAAVQAVRNGLQRIKNLLPGSPIKDGPLKSWNNGGAGKRLMALVAAGIQDGSGAVQRSMEDALQPPRVNLSGLLDRASTASRDAAKGAAGSVTNLSVQLLVQPGATGAQVGAEFVRFVREYEQQTGRKVLAA